jgi:hypothetical protein
MKTLILALGFFTAASAYSATVKVTSFNFVRIGSTLNHPIAELCGKVEGSSKFPNFIRVLVDAGSRRPATYNTLSDDKGNFCLTVTTYNGNADVSIIGENQVIQAQLN